MTAAPERSELALTADAAVIAGAAACSAITSEIGEACARLLLSDSRLIAIVDSYNNGRLILSAIYNRYGCKYQDNRKAQHDLLVALGHEAWAGKSHNAGDEAR